MTRLVALAAGWLLALGLACTATPAPAAAPARQVGPPLEPVRVLHVTPGADLLPYWAAVDGELYARNSLNVQLEAVPNSAVAYPRLLSGEVDLFLTPLNAELARQVASGGDLIVLGGTSDLAIVATRRLLVTREFIFERFLRGTLEGIHALEARPDLASEVATRHLAAAGPEAAQAMAQAYQARPLPKVPLLTPDDLAQAGGNAPLPASLLNQALLQRLEASGFVAALYRA